MKKTIFYVVKVYLITLVFIFIAVVFLRFSFEFSAYFFAILPCFFIIPRTIKATDIRIGAKIVITIMVIVIGTISLACLKGTARNYFYYATTCVVLLAGSIAVYSYSLSNR